MNPPVIKNLISEYNLRKSEIKERLKEFELLHKGRDESIFEELCFCILTANANAVLCGEAIKELKRKNLLFKGKAYEIRPRLKGRVRFHNKKARFIVSALKLFKRERNIDIKSRLNFNNPFEAREWLVENIKGLGYKEASHFLRNIGLGGDIAILDRHILKNLKICRVIRRIPLSLSSRKTYIEIEDKMREFSKKIGIPLGELDLLFWSIETGFIFK